MKIYAYYESIALSNQPEEFACSNWWKQSWTAQGWEPIMLNRSHAQASTLYNKLQQKLVGSALGVPPELTSRFHWITARFSRWCALHAAGGGWMSDYDVFNKAFTPEKAEAYEKTGTLQMNKDGLAYVFFATQEHCANAIKKFIQEPIIENTQIIPESKILHVPDSIKGLSKLLIHAKSSDKLPRSGVMKNAAEK